MSLRTKLVVFALGSTLAVIAGLNLSFPTFTRLVSTVASAVWGS